MSDYLHKHPEFNDLIRTVGQEKNIEPHLIEKDYWIMHVLHGLNEGGFKFELKGGTSLSKGFKIIDRFSEDIDIRIEPPEEMNVKFGRNHNEKAECESRKTYYDWLAGKIKIEGIEEVVRDAEFDDEKYHRNGGIRLRYPSSIEAIEGVKEGILLEVGFDTVTPNQSIDIDSWAISFAKRKNIIIKDNTARAVKCYMPGYTFVEKLQTIVKKHTQQQSDGKLPKNFIRHYYDVRCLLRHSEVQAFIGTAAYHQHKKERFRGAIAKVDLSSAEALLLSDKKTRDLYRQAYEGIKNLYYETQPPFDEILESIKKELHRL